ncbi:alpha/beta hydrolase [Rhizobium sp. Pop5]|uniref:alpha/beta fold hydrolase n=1 Tax=Rhizobium sp. Pop5 TaxID=1223565 RepID=UPI0002839019|nr:alpha/beta hydrolase [Rhizobium sp. Pop5]EJZ17344.1 hypothetical protein RCCGEPOP_31219 [Rhizobium sp. Pop5]UVD59061.1 alpha/beta hydrolase [Rhizobium sp. Pop5]
MSTQKKTIICIPGLGASKASFTALAETILAEKCHVLAIDLPGFGDHCRDSVPDEPVSMAADMLIPVVERIGCQNVILVGHSLGGAVALLTAKRVKGEVWGVASVEGNLVAEDCGMSRRLANASNIAEGEAIKARAVYDAGRSDNEGVRAWSADLAKISYDTLSKYSKNLVDLSDSEVLLQQFLRDSYRRMYLYGEEYVGHPVVPRLSSVQRVFIPKAGHVNFTGDAPDTCAVAISKLL